MAYNESMVGDKSQKRAMCYCDRHATIQYGLKGLPFLQFIFYPPILILFFYVAFKAGETLPRITLLLLLCIYLFVIPLSTFTSTRKQMLKAGHLPRCSRRVALRAMMYIGRFSRFAIIETQESDKSHNSKAK